MTPIKKKLDAIEAELGRAVFVVASAHERFFEPDEDAIRVFMEAAHRRSEKGRPFEKAALLLIGQGGHPAFAEGVVRALRAFWPAFDLILVSRTRGVATLLTFKAERVVMHPWASVGAYDAGPILNGPSKFMDADIQYRAYPILLRPPIAQMVRRWYRNINLLSIAYAFRPRLRSRLTLSGRAFLRKP